MSISLALIVLSLSAPERTYEAEVPVRAITQGRAGHWFGYYDKDQFDPTDRYVLGMEVDFQDRTPTPEDVIELGMVDLEDGDRWIPLGKTRAWSWQQGCMLQWVPGTDDEVIYNDREGAEFISIILNVKTGEKRRLPRAVYALTPDGKRAVGTDFARIDDTRPGYGYKGGVDPGAGELVPKSGGIYVLDLETGDSKTIITYEQIAALPSEMQKNGRHWFNHLLVSPGGERFIFLHRAYRDAPKEGGWQTRMFTANLDGSDLYSVNDNGMVSHFIWKTPTEILAWSREPETENRFHLYTDQVPGAEVVGGDVLIKDGHCTYSPDRQWILTDKYPDSERMHHLMLYRPSDGKLVFLGKFYLSKKHDGEFRCDLHPGWSRNGKYICIDSMNSGDRRQMYLLDVSGVTSAP